MSEIKIDDLFNNSFRNFEAPPPQNLWADISFTMSTNKADQAFRDKLGNLEVKPTDGAWDRISENLPISPMARLILNWLSGVSAALILGMLAAHILDVYSVFSNNSSNKTLTDPSKVNISPLPEYQTARNANTNLDSLKATWEQEMASLKYAAVKDVSTLNDLIEASKTADKDVIIQLPLADISTSEPALKEYVESIQQSYRQELGTNNLSLVSVPVDDNGTRELWMVPALDKNNATPASVNVDGKKVPTNRHYMSKTRFSINAFLQGQNTWMFNDVVRQAFSQSGQVSYKPYLGYSFGIGVSYRLARKWSLLTEIQMESKQGQNYHTEVEGQPSDATVSLHYTKIPLMVRINNDENRHAHFSYLFGLQYAHLNGVGMSSASNDIQVLNNRVINNELGLAAGIDYEMPLTQRLSLLLGGRGSVGVDVSKLSTMFSERNTYNVVFGVRLGLLLRVGKVIP